MPIVLLRWGRESAVGPVYRGGCRLPSYAESVMRLQQHSRNTQGRLMAENDMPTTVAPELVTAIVTSYVTHHSVAIGDLADRLGASRAWSAGRAGCASRGTACSGRAGAPLGAARVCRVPRMRSSRSVAAPPSWSQPWAHARGVPCAMESATRSSDRRAGLCRAAFGHGEGAGARPARGWGTHGRG